MLGPITQPFKYLYSQFKRTDAFSALPAVGNVTNYRGCNYWGVLERKEIVIYNIHGTASKPRAFESFNSQLEQLLKICCPYLNFIIKTPEFKHRFSGNSIEDYAQQLRQQIILADDDKKQMVFIGHSRGGLVCSYLAMVCPLNILSIITIATPFKGAKFTSLPICYIGYPSSLSEMRKYDGFLKMLCNFIQDSSIDFLHFLGTDDRVVKPHACHPHHEEIRHLVQLGKLFLLDNHNHSSILSAPELVLRIFHHIVNRLQLGISISEAFLCTSSIR